MEGGRSVKESRAPWAVAQETLCGRTASLWCIKDAKPDCNSDLLLMAARASFAWRPTSKAAVWVLTTSVLSGWWTKTLQKSLHRLNNNLIKIIRLLLIGIEEIRDLSSPQLTKITIANYKKKPKRFSLHWTFNHINTVSNKKKFLKKCTISSFQLILRPVTWSR